MNYFKIILTFLFVIGCSNTQIKNEVKQGNSASFAYDKMVTWDGKIYVATSEKIDSIDQKIGSIVKSSDKEDGSVSSGFSNHFKVGTILYSIPGIKTDEAIAVGDSANQYIKAVNENLKQN